MTRTEAGIKNARAVWMETKKQLRDQLEQFDQISQVTINSDRGLVELVFMQDFEDACFPNQETY